ncbi:MAG: hypothetical protein LBP59_09645 [Planctomycetaceae bacterium]|jgi:hypothetical protein|nr:hypothetical protein [Planctomycetaceae bacterium]
MFGKKPKKPKKAKEPVEIDYSGVDILPDDLARHVGTFVGLTPEELGRLFSSLGRIDGSFVVQRYRGVKGKNYSRKVGGKMKITDAAEYEKDRVDERREKEKKILDIHGIDKTIFNRDELNDEIYPKRLTPSDIVRSTDAAKERLREIDQERAKQKIEFSPRDEVVLDAMIMVKKYETLRLAQAIADRQRENIIGKSKEQLKEEAARKMREMKGEPEPHVETPEEKILREAREREEERLKRDELAGFDPNYRTLVQEAAELTDENPDAATAIIKQWIGNVGVVENKNNQ